MTKEKTLKTLPPGSYDGGGENDEKEVKKQGGRTGEHNLGKDIAHRKNL